MSLLSMFVSPAFRKPLQTCRGHLLLVAGFSALINILYLAPTIYMMQVYDRVVPTSGLTTLYWLTFVVGLAVAVLAALDALRVQLMHRVSLRLDRLLAPVILDASVLPRPNGSKTSSSGVMRQFDLLRQTLAGPATLAFFDVPWTPLYILVAFMIHPLLGGMLLAGGAVLVLLAWANQRQVKRGADRAHDLTTASYNSMEASLREAECVRALGMRRTMVTRQMQQRRAGLVGSLGIQMSTGRYNSLVKFVRMFMQSLALGTGAWLAVMGEISVGAIIAASVLLSRALQPIEQLVSSWSMVVQAKQAMRTVDGVLEFASSEDVRRTTLPVPQGQVLLDRVCVRGSDPGALILKSVSLELQPGQMLGIVGPSGAGKSTLARTMCGALIPDGGEVRLDGASIFDWGTEQLGPYVGYLPQSCALLPGSVGENISRFAAPDPSTAAIVDAEVVRVAKLTGVHEMILKFPRGYDTQVGDGGHALSAGQVQRICLARALYGSPKLLILDEPNSALDSDGEESLNRAIATAKAAGTTIVIVAHRTFALASADLILVLVEGAVTQFGPKEEVLQELARRAKQLNVVRMAERA